MVDSRVADFATVVAKNAERQLGIKVPAHQLALMISKHQNYDLSLENGSRTDKMVPVNIDHNEILIALTKIEDLEHRVNQLEARHGV